MCLIGQNLFSLYPKFLNFDTLYDTVSKKISKQNNNFYQCFENVARDSPVLGRRWLIDRQFFHLIFKNIIFDILFDAVSQRIKK